MSADQDDPSTPESLRQALSTFPSAVALIAATVDGRPEGLVASSFTVGVSFDPPLVMFAVQHRSSTWPRLRRVGQLGVSVLAAHHEAACLQIASSPPEQRFSGLEIIEAVHHTVFLPGSPLRLRCALEAEHTAGDHDVVVLRVLGSRHEPDGVPLLRHRSTFRRLAVDASPLGSG